MLDGSSDLAERLLLVLDEGAVSTTYKYALLAALIDVSLRNTGSDGAPPDCVHIEDLADVVLELYWPHTDAYPGISGGVLRQSGRGQAEIVRDIRRFRERDPTGRTTHPRARYSSDYPRLVRTVAWKLAEMPLPRLQRVGGRTHAFLYDLGWDETITRVQFDSDDFDRSVTLRPGVAAGLSRLAPLVRPLIHRLWAAQVTTYNRLPADDLDRFLFHRDRISTTHLRAGLLELQGGRCFYTGEVLALSSADVDHFLPWSRTPMNAIENLVVAARSVNGNKRDHLAAVHHLDRWRARNTSSVAALAALAGDNRWESAAVEAIGVARALYLPLRDDHQLWAGPNHFVNADVELARRILAS